MRCGVSGGMEEASRSGGQGYIAEEQVGEREGSGEILINEYMYVCIDIPQVLREVPGSLQTN